jgi:hypothetical protein
MAQQAKQLSVGLGAEANMNTREGAAFGGSIGVEYGISDAWAAGVRFTVSHNFDDTLTLAPSAFARLYVFQLIPLTKVSDAANALLGGVFAQAGAGASMVRQDNYNTAAQILGEFAAGWRFRSGNMYAEPYVRFGVPFLWAAGVNAGYRFNKK